MKKILVILSAIYFTAVPLYAQDATISFDDVIAEPGKEVLVPLNITDLSNVGSASIFVQFDPAVLTYIGIENSSFGGMLQNVNGNELRTSWFSLMPVDLTEKVFDIRFLYNGGPSDLILSSAEITDNLSQPYDIAIVNGSVGDGIIASRIVLTAPVGGEEWLAGTVQNITWNNSEVTNVMIEYIANAGANWTTVVESTTSTGIYEWTIPDLPTDQALVRISDVDDSGVNDISESSFTILSPPVLGDIPDQSIEQCAVFETVQLDNFVSDGDDNDNALVWTASGNVDLLVDIDENRNAVVTVPNSDWTGSETITYTVSDLQGASASVDAVYTVTEENTPPEIVAPPDVTLNLVSDPVLYNGQTAVASDNCDADPVVTSDPALPVAYDAPGVYTITWTATDANGNSASAVQTVTVIFQAPLEVDAGIGMNVSCGESVQIGGSPTAANGKAPYNYVWTPAEGLDNPAGSNPVAGPSETITYTVTVTDADGAVLTDDVTVTITDSEAPVVVKPADAVLELTVNSPATYSGPAAAASDNCDPEPVITSEPVLPVSYDSPGEFTIIWTAADASGNSASSVQKITVIALSTLLVDAGSDTEISCGESVQLGGSPTAADGKSPYKYEWTPSEDLDDPSSPNPVSSPSETTAYTVKVTDADGTVRSNDVTVTVSDNEAPVVVSPADAELELTGYSAATYSGPAATAGDNCDPNPVVTSNPELPVSFYEPGEYTITWTATDASGNSASSVQKITVIESDTYNESNYALMVSTLTALQAVNTGVDKIDRKLEKAAKKFEDCLGAEYWLDDNHLNRKFGKKIFDNGKKMVKELVKVLKDKNVDESIKSDVENILQNLLGAYHSLALISIEDDAANCLDDKCKREIEKRYGELLKAEQEIAKGKPDKAIDKYKKAWECSKKKKKKKDKKKKLRKQSDDDTYNLAGEIPSEYSLEQNYPNPFNPSTLIGFSLPETGSVQLVVFNVIGEEIEVLADGMYAAGYHTVQFNADNLNAGLYLYRLETDNFVTVKKMLLLK